MIRAGGVCHQPTLGTPPSAPSGDGKWVKAAVLPQPTCAAVPPTQSSKRSW